MWKVLHKEEVPPANTPLGFIKPQCTFFFNQFVFIFTVSACHGPGLRELIDELIVINRLGYEWWEGSVQESTPTQFSKRWNIYLSQPWRLCLIVETKMWCLLFFKGIRQFFRKTAQNQLKHNKQKGSCSDDRSFSSSRLWLALIFIYIFI